MPLSKHRLYRFPSSGDTADLAAHLAALAQDVDADLDQALEAVDKSLATSARNAEEARSLGHQLRAQAQAGQFDGAPGAPGKPGPPGLPGNAVPTDAVIAASWSMPGSETRTAMDAHYVTAVETEHGPILYLNGTPL